MRFHFGKIPENNQFQPELEGWLKLKEPKPGMAQFMAFPLGIVAMAILGYFWMVYVNIDVSIFVNYGIVAPLIVMFVAHIVVHELVHLIFHPNNGLSKKSITGFWPNQFLFYAHYEGELSKRRFIMILFLPFIALSVVPLILGIYIKKVSIIWLVLSLINAMSSSIDLLGIIIVGIFIPNKAILKNQGWETYYKLSQNNLVV